MKNKKLQHFKSPGFSVPKKYFEEFEDGILFAVTSTSEEIAPFTGENSGFSIPGNYFSEAEKNILLKTVFEKEKEVKVISLFKKNRIYAAAASIAALFILFMGIFNFEKTEPTTLNNIELSSLENYIENEEINFSISEINDFFEDGNFTSDMDISEIENEVLLEYLDENIIDNSLLTE